MLIHIHGTAPNSAIILTAESQAERDQIARLKKEAVANRADLVGVSYDLDHTLRLRLSEG